MASLSELFGSESTAQQFLIWGVLNQLAGAALAPATADITQAVNSLDPVLPLTPQELAVGVVRGKIADTDAVTEAAKSGTGAGRFAQLVELGKSPPDLGLIIAAVQRTYGQVGPGMSVPVSLDEVLTDLGIDPAYAPLITAATFVQPSAAEVLNAWLEGQIEEAEAVARIQATGLDPSWIQTAYNANGQAPTPVQLLDMWNRGIIGEGGTGQGVVSYDQGFLEGPWRNKWLDSFKALRVYLTPPRTVTAMLKEGSLTEARATQLLQDNGLDAQSIAEYLTAASHTTTVAQRELTQAQIVSAYEDGLLTQDQAHADLVSARFTASDATLLLELADKKKALAASKSAITRLQTLYLSGHNSAAVTRTGLESLGVTDAQVTALIATWDLEKVVEVKTLSEAQIIAAVYYGGLTFDTGVTRIVALGYSKTDAEILIYNRQHGFPKTWVPA